MFVAQDLVAPPLRLRQNAEARLADAAKALVRAMDPAVTLRLSVDGDALLLDLVKVDPEFRGRGLGRDAAERALALADAWGVPVTLYALSLADGGPGPDQAGLEAWYERLGFVRTGATSVMGLAEMRRSPKPPQRSPACRERGTAPQPAHTLVSSRRRQGR